MPNKFLKDLNPEQKKAVSETEGPMIILAGAGSGKTRVITYKVIFLIEKGINPVNILCVTFTNKAAKEMKDRIKKILEEKSQPTVTTFHSLCAKILRIDGKHIGISSKFVIYDQQDQTDAIKEVFKKLNISVKDYKPSSVLATISQAKNELIDENNYKLFARGHFQEKVAEIYPHYQNLLKENDALDFDDLILKAAYLLDSNKNILEKYQDNFRYILIDEYQDTNRAQYLLTKMLSYKWNNICVVGDFSQSIYSWRGADYKNLTRFKNDFENVKTFSLSQNYRSTQKILDAASSVISKNTSHPVLNLWTNNEEGENINIYEARNEQDEAKYIIEQILNIKFQNPDAKYSNIAILYRINAQSRVIEEAFLHNGIPYTIVGGTRFYERKEIKDLISYLRLLTNPKDMVSYKRLEKLGKGRFKKFLEFQDSFDPNSNLSTIEILDNILKYTEYLLLYDEKDQDDRQRLENIKELRSVAIEFPNISQFLENVALVEQEYFPDDEKKDGLKKDAITLMTLHAAKGLEFPIVFIIGLEEGLFPHSRSLMEKAELEEERRLCYVGMTRAKQKLFLTYSKQRLFFGQKTSNIISRFILELPEDILSQSLYVINKDSDGPEFL